MIRVASKWAVIVVGWALAVVVFLVGFNASPAHAAGALVLSCVGLNVILMASTLALDWLQA